MKGLFNNIPEKRFLLPYFSGEEPKADKILAALSFKNSDVVRATGMSKGSVRLDDRIPQELVERLREWGMALSLVESFFKDHEKTILWFQTPNSLLGGFSPREMIRIGRFQKLMRFISQALEENQSQAA